MECRDEAAGGWLRADGRKRSVRHGSPNGKVDEAENPGDRALASGRVYVQIS